MTYPKSNPTMKHDLQCTQVVPTESKSLLEEMGMSSSSNMFRMLEEGNVSNPSPICSVYAYSDAPDIPAPLSRSLIICGFADSTISLVRKVMSDDGLPDELCKSTIAVQLADERHFSRLEPRHQNNSTKFARFMKRLRKESSVAVISKDKYNRFGLLAPMTKANPDAEAIDSEDCAAFLYTSTLHDVRELFGSARQREVTPVDHSQNGDLWQPPGNDSSGEPEALWRPPGSEDYPMTNTPKVSWQPGGSGNSNPWNADEGGGKTDIWGSGAGQSGIKRGFEEISDAKGEDSNENNFHNDTAAAAADAFYSGLTRNLDTRADSRLYHMRAFNGWVKATQISELNPRILTDGTAQPLGPLRVLDLACGKGGDLTKWSLHQRGMTTYCGIDVARGSLKDAAIRIREMRKRNKLKNTKATLICADLGADVPGRKKSPSHKHMQKLLTWSLQSEAEVFQADPPEFNMVRGGGVGSKERFDVVSIQFAIHYMMSTSRRARRFFHTVSELLDIGGNLICTTIDARVVVGHLMSLGLDYHFDRDNEMHTNTEVQAGAGACRITFEPEIVKRIVHSNSDEDLFGLQYTFTLVEGSDHEAGVGDAVNLPEWLTPMPVLEALGQEAGLELEYAENFHEFFENRNEDPSARNALYNMRVLNRNGTITEEEWSICRLYAAIRFRKVRESSINLVEEEHPNQDESDREEEEPGPSKIDPIEEKKKLPMAMLKAKKTAGEEKWKRLSSEEKKRLTQIELATLLRK